MSLTKQLRDIGSMEQLGAYLDKGRGQVDGQYWMIETGDSYGEGEVGLPGTYRSVSGEDNDQKVVTFEPMGEISSILPVVEITEQHLGYAAVKVFSRRSL